MISKTARLAGLIYAAGDVGVTVKQLSAVTSFSKSTVKRLVSNLNHQNSTSNRSPFKILRTGDRYRLVTKTALRADLQKFFKNHHTSVLTPAELETLTIVAYRQPVTRIEIDALRGVNSSITLRHLNRQKLVRPAGHKATIGNPVTYRTTAEFLNLFGLSSIHQLPKLKKKM